MCEIICTDPITNNFFFHLNGNRNKKIIINANGFCSTQKDEIRNDKLMVKEK